MSLSPAQAKVDTWSKCTLIGAVLLFVYSLAALFISIHMDHEWHRRHQQTAMMMEQQQQQQQQIEPAFGRPDEPVADMVALPAKNQQRPQQNLMLMRPLQQQQQQEQQPEPQVDPVEPADAVDIKAGGAISSSYGRRNHHHHDDRLDEHRHHRRHHHRFEAEGACRLHHFAVLGLLTSVTGVISAFKTRRGWAVAFLVLVLITELSALGFVGYKNAKSVQKCAALATEQTVLIRQETFTINNQVEISRSDVVGVSFDVNKPKLEDCVEHVKHASVLACLMIGVVACSLACCGAKHSKAILERDEEAEAQSQQQVEAKNNSCILVDDQTELKPVVAIIVASSQQEKEQPVQI